MATWGLLLSLIALSSFFPRLLLAAPRANPDQSFLKILDSKRAMDEFEFSTTKGLWRKWVGAEEGPPAGVGEFVSRSFVYLTKGVGSALTIPYDVLAAPARTHLGVKWKISGQVLDSAGTAVAGADLHFAVGSCDEDLFGETNFCEATAKSDLEGRFTFVLAGAFMENERIEMVSTANAGQIMLQADHYLAHKKKIITLESANQPGVPIKEFVLRLGPLK